MMLNLQGGHRASVSGGQPSWQPQHVWKTSPGHCQQTSCVRSRGGVFWWTPPPPPPPLLPPLASLMWGEAERQELGWKSALTDWGKVTAVVANGGGWLWNELWQPVNITGPHASQHLICYLSQSSFRTYEQIIKLFVPKGVKLKMQASYLRLSKSTITIAWKTL